METNDDIQKDNIEEKAQKLFSVKNENPFVVPGNYFDNLSDEITDKCVQQDSKKSSPFYKGSFQRVFIPLAVAASVIIIILINHKKQDIPFNHTDQFAYVDNSAASAYLENLIDNNDLDESLIVSILINDDTLVSNSKDVHTEAKIKAMNENPVILKDTVNNVTITEDDIIQYLLEEDESDDLLN